MPPLPWAEPFAGACLLRGFVGLFAVCYRFAAGRHALNRFCVAPDLCLICLVPTCLVPTCLVLNLLCVAPAFAEPPLCRSRFPRRGPCRMSQKNNCREQSRQSFICGAAGLFPASHACPTPEFRAYDARGHRHVERLRPAAVGGVGRDEELVRHGARAACEMPRPSLPMTTTPSSVSVVP